MSAVPSVNTPSEDRHVSSTSTLVAQATENEQAQSDAHLYELVPHNEVEDEHPGPALTSTQSLPKEQAETDDQARNQTKAGTLAKTAFQWWFVTPLDVVLALSPLFFLIIAVLSLFLNNRPKSKYGEDVKSITLLSPTIFPIVYAAILGKMLRRVGLYKAERSATIGTVERLVGCQSLFSSFERQFAFKRFDVLGVSILMAWLLSPLGGQASLRLLSTKPLLVDFTDSVKYYPVEGFARQTHLFHTKIASTAWPLFSPMYITALLTSNKYLGLPVDLFDNVKIPDIMQLPSYMAHSNDSDWHVINRDTQIGYASALGIPVAGLPETGNSSFTLVSHHWAVSCAAFEFEYNFDRTGTRQVPTFDMIKDITRVTDNDTRFRYESRYVIEEIRNSTGLYPSGRLSKAKCTTYPFLVESHVQCQGRFCDVSEMRRLHRKPDEIIGNYESASAWFGMICANMPGADMGMLQDNNTSSELVEHWMVDSSLSTFQWDESLSQSHRSAVSKRWVDVAKLPSEIFSRRLQMAINIFWDASIGSTVRMGNLTKEQVAIFEASGFKFSWNTTELRGTRYAGEQYVCQVWFAVSTIVISLLLFIAGLASLILGMLNKAPDTLGFASTSARDNPYVTTHVASHLDGLAAARELQDVRIRIGDVNGTGDIGHVAFASMDAEPGRVSRKRLYD